MSTSPVQISEVQADYLNNEASTAQTIAIMCAHIRQSLNDPELQRVAGECGAGSRRDRCAAVWRWLKANVRFVLDEDQLQRTLGRSGELELLISPSVLLRARRPEGDCDDFTMLGCALLACLGVPPLIKTFKCDAQDPSRWSHVCAAALLEDGSVFPVDASHGGYPGWEVPPGEVYESQLWDMTGNRVGGGGMGKHRGLSGYVQEPDWTGNEMTTTQGRVAGPYESHDVMRAYYPGPSRSATLQRIARGKYTGMGALVCDTNEGTPYCYDDGTGDTGARAVDAPTFPSTQPTSLPGGGYTYSIPGGSLPAPGTSLASILAALIPAGTRLGQQALASPGTTIMPNGAIVTGTPQGTSALSSGLGGMSPLLILGLVAVGVLVLAKGK